MSHPPYLYLLFLGLALHHVVIGSFTEVAGVGLLAVHDEDGRADLVDVVEESAVAEGLCAVGVSEAVLLPRSTVTAAGGRESLWL